MTHLTDTPWDGYETEPRTVEIVVASSLSAGQIDSAQLRIDDQAAIDLTASSSTGGYTLTGTLVIPSAGLYAWAAEVTDSDGNTPIVVAAGSLRSLSRVPVST